MQAVGNKAPEQVVVPEVATPPAEVTLPVGDPSVLPDDKFLEIFKKRSR